MTQSRPPEPASSPSEEVHPPAVVVEGTTQLLKVSYKLMTVLCYLPFMSIVSSAAALATEPMDNKFVRFHAWQSLFMLGAVFAGTIVGWCFMFIPIFGAMANLVITGFYFYKSVMMMLDVAKGKMTKLPIIGKLADEML